jgi:FKBP-type peptidyl-prolyl cis-trans isomerase
VSCSPRRLFAAVLTAGALVALAACGSSGGSTGSGATTSARAGATVKGATGDPAILPAVTGAAGAKPTIATPTAKAPTALTAKVVAPGTGATVASGDQVVVNYLGMTWEGKEFDNSFDRNEAFSFKVGGGEVIPGWDQGLVGQVVGSRVLLGIPSALGYGAQGAGADIPPNTALLFVVDVVASFGKGMTAKGTVVPLDDAALPKVTGDGATLAVAVPGGAAPTELVVKTLVQGDGAEVQAGQQIAVQYLGVLWDGGKVFDASWARGGEPISFGIGTGRVIKGWDQGLVGVKAGSRVLLVIPSDLAYGDEGRPPTIPAKAPLVFVVDVLGSF